MQDFKTIIQQCKEKDIMLKIIIPPIHASQLEAIVASGSWEAYEQWKRKLVEIAPIIDFTSYNEFTTEAFSKERKHFFDSSHMNSNIGNLILDILANRKAVDNFGVLITPDNIEQHLQNIRNQRDAWRANNPELVEKIAFFKGFLPRKPRILQDKAAVAGKTVVRVDHLMGQSFQAKQAMANKSVPLTIAGWSVAGGKISKEAFLMLKAADGREYYAVLDKVKRQDVADMLQNNEFVDSGFSGISFCDDVPIGHYELYLFEVNEGGQLYSALLGQIEMSE